MLVQFDRASPIWTHLKGLSLMAATYNITLNSECHFYRLQAGHVFPLSGIFPANFDPGQPRPGQAGLAAWPRLPRFFYPLASPAKARPLAVLTPAFRPGFDPGLPRSGQAPDARDMQPLDKDSLDSQQLSQASGAGEDEVQLYVNNYFNTN